MADQPTEKTAEEIKLEQQDAFELGINKVAQEAGITTQEGYDAFKADCVAYSQALQAQAEAQADG